VILIVFLSVFMWNLCKYNFWLIIEVINSFVFITQNENLPYEVFLDISSY